MASSDYQAKAAYHGQTAARYDQDRVVEPIWEIEQKFCSEWAATLSPGTTVLDIPTGTGRFVELLLARGVNVQALDISEDMLAELRKRYPVPNPALVIAKGDAEQLAAADDSVDQVICWRFFHLIPLPTINRVLAEFRRVCHGRIIVQVLPVNTGGSAFIPGWLKAALRPLRRLVAKHRTTSWSHIPSFVHAERDLLKCFSENRLRVAEAVTIATYQGLPVRVYTLERQA